MDNIQSLNYFWPELIIVTTALAAIIIDFFYDNKQSYRVGYWVLTGLVFAFIAMPFCGTDIVTTLFTDMVAYDPFAVFFKVLILISTIHKNIAPRRRRPATAGRGPSMTAMETR